MLSYDKGSAAKPSAELGGKPVRQGPPVVKGHGERPDGQAPRGRPVAKKRCPAAIATGDTRLLAMQPWPDQVEVDILIELCTACCTGRRFKVGARVKGSPLGDDVDPVAHMFEKPHLWRQGFGDGVRPSHSRCPLAGPPWVIRNRVLLDDLAIKQPRSNRRRDPTRIGRRWIESHDG